MDHYKQKTGKWLGIYDQHKYKSYSELYTKWGFTNYFVSTKTQRDDAVNKGGFDPDSIMANVVAYSNGQFSYPPGEYKYYFLDEPFERQKEPLTVDQVINIAHDISHTNSSAKLLISSWKRVGSIWSWGYSTVLSNAPNTQMMCDQYHDGSIFCGNDQRDYWTTYKNYYSSGRVKSHWISLYIDGDDGDFDQLIGHANNLGINTLWLYAGNKGTGACDDGEILTESIYKRYLDDFCAYAFNSGWLRKFVREYRYYWHCYFPGDPCYCQSHPEEWQLVRIDDMHTVKEVFN